jgi:colanic acid/amylovoran biosynthesis protein
MTKILMTGTFSSLNKGDAAMQISTMYAVKKYIHDAVFTLLTPFPEIDSRRYTNVKIVKSSLLSPSKLFLLLFRCVLWSISHKVFCSNLKKLIDQKELQEYVQAEIILHVSGDGFGEVYSVPAAISQYCVVLLGILLNKPVVIYAQSLGPFKITKFLARSILNKVALITVREELSEQYLQKTGVNRPPIYLTADSSFLLRPATEERVNEIMMKEGCNKGGNHFVCISASRLIASRYKHRKSRPKYPTFIELMAQLVDYLTTELNAMVILLPHVIGPYERTDDRILAKQIYEMVKLKHKAKVINNEYTPREIRGIFRRCDLLIGGRTHACIAAISMGVPTIAIAYSHKTYGIMKMLDLEKYICDASTLEINELTSKIDELLLAREKIKRELMPKIKVVHERALFNAKLVKKLINSLRARTPCT